MSRRRLFAAIAALVPALAAGLPLAAQLGQLGQPTVSIEADDERPEIGQTVRLTARAAGVPLAGARVVAEYRPNSSTTSTEELAPTDAAGTVSWTPTAAGPVRLQVWAPGAAPDTEPAALLAVAVRYGRFLPSGLLIMLTAGALLVGGATLGSIMLMKGPLPLPDSEPPST